MRFELDPPHPNPFNPATSVAYRLDGGGLARVRLDVFDLLGRRVRTLVSGLQERGKEYRVRWDGTDATDCGVASGSYLLHLRVDGKGQTRKLTVIQ
jgi:hypothetical protein